MNEPIRVAIPYEPGRSLGTAYNKFMERLPADGWALLMDHDVLHIHPQWYDVCARTVEAHGDTAGLITCWTNRIKCQDQQWPGAPAGDDINEHRETAKDLWIANGLRVTDITNAKPKLAGGFFMLTSRRAWEQAGGFKKGFDGVDNDYHRRIKGAGLRVLRMDGLYCYHRRERQDRDWWSIQGDQERRCVYTVITGDYDRLRRQALDPHWDYICFTDNPDIETVGPWKVRVLPANKMPQTLASRRPKILAHEYLPDYDYSLYIDANVRLVAPPGELCDLLGWADWGVSRHPRRTSVYDEASAIIQQGKADPKKVSSQIQAYRNAGLPDMGMTENNVIARRHNEPAVVALQNAWWAETTRYTHRDQLSFPCALWRRGNRISTWAAEQRVRFYNVEPHEEVVAR